MSLIEWSSGFPFLGKEEVQRFFQTFAVFSL